MKQSYLGARLRRVAGGGLGHANATVRVCKNWEKAELKSARKTWAEFTWAGELCSLPRLGKFYQ